MNWEWETKEVADHVAPRKNVQKNQESLSLAHSTHCWEEEQLVETREDLKYRNHRRLKGPHIFAHLFVTHAPQKSELLMTPSVKTSKSHGEAQQWRWKKSFKKTVINIKLKSIDFTKVMHQLPKTLILLAVVPIFLGSSVAPLCCSLLDTDLRERAMLHGSLSHQRRG